MRTPVSSLRRPFTMAKWCRACWYWPLLRYNRPKRSWAREESGFFLRDIKVDGFGLGVFALQLVELGQFEIGGQKLGRDLYGLGELLLCRLVVFLRHQHLAQIKPGQGQVGFPLN